MWILGGIGAAISGLVVLFLARRKTPPLIQPAVPPCSSSDAKDRKAKLAEDASQARTSVLNQVSGDLKKIRDRFGVEKK